MDIAGVVLGAIPVLFEALDAYKDGYRRIKSGFRKREHVKRLARALRMQGQILDALTRDVLLHSGCTIPADESQLQDLLRQQPVKDDIVDFLGEKNTLVLTEALDDCLSTIQVVATRIAELVPSVKTNAQIQEVLDANKVAPQAQIDFLARITLMISLADLDRDIEALDRSSNTLERFANRIVASSGLAQAHPSRKAIKLARSLQIVRRHADRLYIAIANHWNNPCHIKHEVRIFLDERLGQSSRQSGRNGSDHNFKVVLSSNAADQTVLWYNAMVHIDSSDSQDHSTPQLTKVQIVVSPPSQLSGSRRPIDDLCLTIHDAIKSRCQTAFYLLTNNKIAVTQTSPDSQTQHQDMQFITLDTILSGTSIQSRPPSFKSRMILALKLVSSFLQFLRTSWIQAHWSSTEVHFLRDNKTQSTTATSIIDLSQPHLSRTFTATNSAHTPQSQAQIKDDLVDLGILLLEIWHWTSLEAKFANQQYQSTTVSPYHRRGLALAWLDDVQDPLPELYNKAVSHCIVGISVIDQIRSCTWDDIQLWKVLCENVIDPLFKISQI